jgi:NADPH-dependent curcumin reductase CurA
MNAEKGYQIVLASRPVASPEPTNFRLEEFAVPAPSDGEILVRTEFLSLDPYMRGRMRDQKSYAKPTEIGQPMEGTSVTTVLASRNSAFKEGDTVLAPTRWRTHSISDGTNLRKLDPNFAPPTTALGVLGMPGFTAYSGMKMIGRIKAGETLVVAAASGPVGSLVGQIAKQAGARAIGVAGGAEKCEFAKSAFGFDAVIDHRSPDFAKQLSDACPSGIDVYFENVGGAVWQAVLPLLNLYARVPVCGLVAQYNGIPGQTSGYSLEETMRQIIAKSLSLRGYINSEFTKELFPAFLKEIGAGVSSGAIKYREDYVNGLDSAPAAFIGLLQGKNFGKLIVRMENP